MEGSLMLTYLVLLGPPGAGKGTQAQKVSQQLGLPHISSGDIFRENLKNQTDLGKLAKGFIERGELVPDDLTISMIRDRLARPDCASGALLDGFPRTPAQADALAEMLAGFGGKVNAVPYIKVAEDVLIERLTGRWTCRAQGHVYHIKFNPPKQAGVCDVDGSELYQRDDDKAETVINRIQVYFQQTMPLIAYYQKAGSLMEVDGAQAIEAVTVDLMAGLASRTVKSTEIG
jgi:adenylate kinase